MDKEKTTIYPEGLLWLFNKVTFDEQIFIKHLLCARFICETLGSTEGNIL